MFGFNFNFFKKTEYNPALLDIGSGALRCLRWAVKNSAKDKSYLVGYHMGKTYAYLWVLSKYGLVEFLDKRVVYEPINFIKTYRKGRIWIFPPNEPYIWLMKKDFFEAVLVSKQPHQGPTIIKGIRKLCKEIC